MFDHTSQGLSPLRPNDRWTDSVAVHAMPGAKWSALANQWVRGQRLSIMHFSDVEAKECSDCSARFLRRCTRSSHALELGTGFGCTTTYIRYQLAGDGYPHNELVSVRFIVK